MNTIAFDRSPEIFRHAVTKSKSASHNDHWLCFKLSTSFSKRWHGDYEMNKLKVVILPHVNKSQELWDFPSRRRPILWKVVLWCCTFFFQNSCLMFIFMITRKVEVSIFTLDKFLVDVLLVNCSSGWPLYLSFWLHLCVDHLSTIPTEGQMLSLIPFLLKIMLCMTKG